MEPASPYVTKPTTMPTRLTFSSVLRPSPPPARVTHLIPRRMASETVRMFHALPTYTSPSQFSPYRSGRS